MIRVLLDTDVIIECLRNNSVVISALEELVDKGTIICYSPVSKAEIYGGMRLHCSHSTGNIIQ